VLRFFFICDVSLDVLLHFVRNKLHIIFNVSSSDIAMECMYIHSAISDIIVKRKRKFLHRYAGSDSIVCIECNKFVIKDLSGLEDTT